MVCGWPANSRGGRASAAMFLLAVAALLLPGCGGDTRPKTVPVKGTVTFRGKPLANARVTFYGAKAPMPAVGDTNENGEFELSMYGKGDGALAGENKVTVTMLTAGGGAGAMMPLDPTKMATGGSQDLPLKAEVPRDGGKQAVTLPKVYGDSSNTPLVEQVGPEGNLNVKLELK